MPAPERVFNRNYEGLDPATKLLILILWPAIENGIYIYICIYMYIYIWHIEFVFVLSDKGVVLFLWNQIFHFPSIKNENKNHFPN